MNLLSGATSGIHCEERKLELLLKNTPMQLRTYEQCKRAVVHNWRALAYVPPAFLKTNDYELCQLAFAQNNRAIYVLPETLRTDAIFRVLLHVDPRAFSHFPKERRTIEMCAIGAKLDSSLYHHIPNLTRSVDLRQIAEISLAESIRQLLGETEQTES